MRTIKKHIIHASDSTFGDVNIIRQWHLERGWSDIGYHFVILPSGAVEIGRPVEKIGAHTRGQNKYSIGTCLIGKTEFTKAQFNSLKALHICLSAFFPTVTAHGHREFNPNKTCPNFDVSNVLS